MDGMILWINVMEELYSGEGRNIKIIPVVISLKDFGYYKHQFFDKTVFTDF